MTSNTPNIILVISDTFRRDHLGFCDPTGKIRTPNLNDFAEQSVVFDQHRLSSFPTMPARADFLTGTFSFTHMTWEPLPVGLETLPSLLRAAGYVTMAVVDTPFLMRGGMSYDRGFDDFVWIWGQGDDLRPNERADSRSQWRHESDRFVARTITRAEEWLEQHYKDRFFLYVDTWDPHEPWDAPDYYTRLYDASYGGEQIYPPYARWQDVGLTEQDVQRGHAMYCGEVTMVDRWFGRLLSKIDVLGIRENTVVCFASDHGFYFGEHGYFGKADQDSWFPTTEVETKAEQGWLGSVRWSPLHAEIVRVPLMMRVPGVEAGTREVMTSAADLAPTLVELGGGGVPPTMQGQSLVKLLYDGKEAHRDFAISAWPLKFREGSMSIAVDSRPRQVLSGMPITVSTVEGYAIAGVSGHGPEYYRTEADGSVTLGDPANALPLVEGAIEELQRLNTDPSLLEETQAAWVEAARLV